MRGIPNDGLSLVVLAIVGPPLLLLSFLVLPFVLYVHERKTEARRAEMESESRELDMEFSAAEDPATARALNFLAFLEDGPDRYALNNLWGKYKGHDVEIFDYHYKEEGVWFWAPSWHKHRYYSFIILKLEKEFPELLLNTDYGGPLKRVAKLFGSKDIDFESREFSERFDVRCRDKKFAYDFCNARMIEYLLSKPTIPIEVEQNVIAVGFRTPIPTAAIEEHIDHLINIRRLMPDYLFEIQKVSA